MEQEQFLDVIDRDEAERRFQAVLDLRPLETEQVPLHAAWQRVLAEDIKAPIDVPGFDRSNMDGFAVRAADTFGASDEAPCELKINQEHLEPGRAPQITVHPGSATSVATGAVIPRGADAVVMVEHTLVRGDSVRIVRPSTPGSNVTFAGTDIGRGETVLRRGELLTARETGVLAALGIAEVPVVRKANVALLSTGGELVAPGGPLHPGQIYDSNATVLADTVRELGGEPVHLGIVPDDLEMLRAKLRVTLDFDLVLLSGGTSKGPGDISYRTVAELGSPGVVAHGVALKPGKPLCLAVVARQKRRPLPVAVLPGFPTSAIFTFHEFLAPVLRAYAGLPSAPKQTVTARMAQRVQSERGRTEYLLVHLLEETPKEGGRAFLAYPMGKGSGSVTSFSRADGYITIPRQREYLEGDEQASVLLLGQGLAPADLVVIGSHCVGLDYLLGQLRDKGYRSKTILVGSQAGLRAAKIDACDVATMHLLHPESKIYNSPYLDDRQLLVKGYGRLQGIVFRPQDLRFAGKSLEEAVAHALNDAVCILINRNQGSGTRILVDQLLAGRRPTGYLTEARSHNAVAAAVAQGRADWGIAIETVARDVGLGFLPLQHEQYDFVIPRTRIERAAVRAFIELLASPEVRTGLMGLGFAPLLDQQLR